MLINGILLLEYFRYDFVFGFSSEINGQIDVLYSGIEHKEAFSLI